MAARSNKSMMKRSARVYLNDLNPGKLGLLVQFLALCHDMQQFFIDLFWQRRDFTGKLAELPLIHRAVQRFKATTRLSQAMAKQAKETLASRRQIKRDKPRLRRHVSTLFYHFATVEKFNGAGFDWCAQFKGSGAPRLIVPFKSTRLIKRRLADGWTISKTIRLGRAGRRLWIDLIMEKPRPAPKQTGEVVGMDSNYKAGFVFSNGVQIGREIYDRIQQFGKRQKHTFAEIDSMVGQALKQVDWPSIRVLAIEDLRRVKQGRRGTFPRHLNRRLSHWLYRASAARIERHCEEHGILLEYKDPWKTSQRCPACGKWDRRNRRGDRFLCVECGHTDHADFNAAKNLEALAMAGIYGFRFPQSPKCQSF